MIALLIPSFHGGKKLLTALRSVMDQRNAFDHIFISINGDETHDLSLLQLEGFDRDTRITIFQTKRYLPVHMHLASCVGKMAAMLGNQDYLFVLCHDDVWTGKTEWDWVVTECKEKNGRACFPYWSLVNDQGQGIREKVFFHGIKPPEEAIFSSIDQEGTYTNLSGIGVPFAAWKSYGKWCSIKKSAARTELMLASHRVISNLVHVPGLKIQVEVSPHSDGASLSQKQIAWDEIIFYAWLLCNGRVVRWKNWKTSVRKVWSDSKYLLKLYCPSLYHLLSLKKRNRQETL